MLEEDLKNIVKKIVNMQAEFQTVEVKKCNSGTTEKLYDTISSFSNQDDGGVIVFGIDEKNNFDICGVYDVQDLQKKVMEQCSSMTPVVRAVFTVCEINGKNIVSAEIPPTDVTQRPCFYNGKGRIKGSYIRVADADIPMTEYEVYSYEAYRKKYQDDIRLIDSVDLSVIDKDKLQNYILTLKLNKPNLAWLTDEQIYSLMSIEKNGTPSLSTLLVFGLFPQATFPQLDIISTSYIGTQVGETGTENERFADNRRIDGTIPEMLEAALIFVKNNIKTKTIIDSNTGKHIEKPDYPLSSVREAILNALVHRDYSIHTQGMPIQILMFSDRMEIISPGGLYGRVTVDNLGKIQPDTRNPILATMLEALHITKNRYSGIPTIRREFSEWNLPAPEFINQRGEFTVIFRKGLSISNEADTVSDKILKFCQTPKTRKEISEFLKIKSVSYMVNTYIKPLIEQNKLRLSIPDKPSSPNQKYFSIK